MGGDSNDGGTPSTGGTSQGGTGEGGSGGNPDDPWSCIGELQAPMYFAGDLFDANVTVTDFTAAMNIPDADVLVCGYADADCANPTSQGVTDASGIVALQVATDVRLFMDVSSPDVMPTLIFQNGPPAQSPMMYQFAVLTPTQLGQFVQLAGGTSVDPTRGHIGIAAIGCDFSPAAGVTLTVDLADEDTTYGYFTTQGVPGSGLTETTADGRLGIANVPPGDATITAEVAATGEIIGTRTVHVRAGTVSYAPQMTAAPEAVE
jgi:hypothetical protein